MFRRNSKKLLVAGLGLAALIASSSALAGGPNSNQNVSPTASNSVRYGAPDGWTPYVESLTKTSQASRYGAPDGWTPYVESLTKASQASRYGAPDGWTPYVESLTSQSLLDGRSQDIATTETAIALSKSLTPVDGRSPDTIDAAIAAPSVGFDPNSPEARARLVAQGYIDGSTFSSVPDGRSQDIRTTEQALQLSQTVAPADGRSPDTIDAGVLAHSPFVTITRTPGFQWGDFGIGTGVAFAAMILLALGLRRLSGRQDRKSTPVATA
jgi:hypothetical protein